MASGPRVFDVTVPADLYLSAWNNAHESIEPGRCLSQEPRQDSQLRVVVRTYISHPRARPVFEVWLRPEPPRQRKRYAPLFCLVRSSAPPPSGQSVVAAVARRTCPSPRRSKQSAILPWASIDFMVSMITSAMLSGSLSLS